MTEAQETAFSAGAGGLSAGDIALLFASVVAVVYLLWLVWLALGQFRAWWAAKAEIDELVWTLIRGSIVVLLVGYFVRP